MILTSHNTSVAAGGTTHSTAPSLIAVESGGTNAIPVSPMPDRIVLPAPPPTEPPPSSYPPSLHYPPPTTTTGGGGDFTSNNNNTVSPRGTDAYLLPHTATDNGGSGGMASPSSNAYFQTNRSQGQSLNSPQRRADKGRRLKPVSNAVIAAKTRLCVKFEKGTCTSPACTFAHGSLELRKKPDLRKTKLCESFSAINSCAKGSDCTYAHGIHELQATSEYFKTSICPNWKQGHCDAGAHCRHAHGTQELRVRPPVPKRALPLHALEFPELPGPDSSNRFASATGSSEGKSGLLSTESALITDDTSPPPHTRSPAAGGGGGRARQDSTSEFAVTNSSRSTGLIGGATVEESELVLQQQTHPNAPPSDAHSRMAPSGTRNAGASADKFFYPSHSYAYQRPNPPQSAINRSAPRSGGGQLQQQQQQQHGWQPGLSLPGTHRAGYPASDPHYMCFHDSTESHNAFPSVDGISYKNSSPAARRSLVVSAPAPPPPPPEPDGPSPVIMPRPPPAASNYPSNPHHRHQRQVSEMSVQKGMRRTQPNFIDNSEHTDLRGSGSKAWAKQSLQQHHHHHHSGGRPMAWKSQHDAQHPASPSQQQQQQQHQMYDPRSLSTNHSRPGGGGAGASAVGYRPNAVNNHIPRQTNTTSGKNVKLPLVSPPHQTTNAQPLLLFVNSSRGVPPSIPSNGNAIRADSDSLSPIDYPPILTDYTPVAKANRPASPSKMGPCLTESVEEAEGEEQKEQHSAIAGPTTDSGTPATLHLTRPGNTLGYFPFDLPTVKEVGPAAVTPPSTSKEGSSLPAAGAAAPPPPPSNALTAPVSNPSGWNLCYGDRRASSIDFNQSNLSEGRTWGTRASSVVYPSGFNRRASRQSAKDDGSVKPAAAEAYPLAALVGKTMENAAPHRRRGTQTEIKSMASAHARSPSPRADEMRPVPNGERREAPSPSAPTRDVSLSPDSKPRHMVGASFGRRSLPVPQQESLELHQIRASYINRASAMSAESPKALTPISHADLFTAFPPPALHSPPPVLGQPANPPDMSHPVAEGTPLPATFSPPNLLTCDAFSAAMGSLAVTPLLSIIPSSPTFQPVPQPLIPPSSLVVSPAMLPPWTSNGMLTRQPDGGHSFIPIAYSSPMLSLDLPIYVGGYAPAGPTSPAPSRELTLLPFPAPALAAQVMPTVDQLPSAFVPPPPFHLGAKESVFEYAPDPTGGVLGE